MPKKPVSVTLDADNLLWLRGRTVGDGRRSLSDTLDRIVTEARLGSDAGSIRSVVGTADISGDDPGLDAADGYVQGLFARSAARPMLARERRLASKPARKRRRG